MNPKCLAAFFLALVGLAGCTAPSPTRQGPGYQYYVVGNVADVVKPTSGLWVLQGGGDDVDENYVRMGARGGGGDFVVLRASGADDYNQYIFDLCKCDSVETIVFDDRVAASDPFVIQTIRNAEALFIGGGDQDRYVRFWKGAPVQDAINYVAAKPAPIGGTSAGMAILGEFVYSSEHESLTSAVALANPYALDVTLQREFLALPGLGGILTDQHLQERDRIGRTVTMLARLMKDGWSSEPHAVAADRETAVHIDPSTYTAEVFTTATHPTPYAYFMRPTQPPERCEAGQPLTFREVEVYRIGPGGRFDLKAWQGTGGISYRLSVKDGALSSSRESNY